MKKLLSNVYGRLGLAYHLHAPAARKALLVFVGATAPVAAHADTLGNVFQRIGALGSSGVSAITAIAYLVGAGFAVYGIANIKSLGNSRNEPGKGIAVIMSILAGAGLIYLPYAMQTSAETVFGSAAQSQGAGGTNDLNR